MLAPEKRALTHLTGLEVVLVALYVQLHCLARQASVGALYTLYVHLHITQPGYFYNVVVVRYLQVRNVIFNQVHCHICAEKRTQPWTTP